jgi:hypothetical protein
MNRALPALAIVLLIGTLAPAHRLDEYLQGTLISVEKDRVDAQITLTPGVAVFPFLIADIDRNGDGAISETEQRWYAERILRDVSVLIDGHRLSPHLVSMEYPPVEEMKEGRGAIRIEFDAGLPRGGPARKLIFENRHQRRIAAYQVNALVPRDPDIHIGTQHRNYSQSFYELDYVQAGAEAATAGPAWPAGAQAALGMVVLFLLTRLALLLRQRNGLFT